MSPYTDIGNRGGRSYFDERADGANDGAADAAAEDGRLERICMGGGDW